MAMFKYELEGAGLLLIQCYMYLHKKSKAQYCVISFILYSNNLEVHNKYL